MTFKFLDFKRIISHEVRCLDDEKNKFHAVCDDNLIRNLPDKVKYVLAGRITALVGSADNYLAMDVNPESEFFHLVRDIPTMDEAEFVIASKRAAERLARVQHANARNGQLLVIYAVNDMNQNMVLFIKAEYGSALQKRQSSLKFLEDIILTQDSKVYKIGAFIEEGDKWTGVLHDHQMTPGNKASAAQYFYHAFLELEFSEDDKFLTLKFYEYTKKFINEKFDDPDRTDYQNALALYLKAKDKLLVSVSEFAPTLYGKESEYKNFMCFHMKFPERIIRKDLSLIKKKSLNCTMLYFDRGIAISVPPEELNETLFVFDNREDAMRKMAQDDECTFIGIKSRLIHKK